MQFDFREQYWAFHYHDVSRDIERIFFYKYYGDIAFNYYDDAVEMSLREFV